MRILVVGASGLVGRYVVDYATKQNHEVFVSIHRSQIEQGVPVSLDLFEPTTISKTMKSVKPEAVINCAANPDINYCEINRDDAYKLNTLGVKYLCDSIPTGCFFVQLSTDNVFDGVRGEYTEEAETSPVNWYGKTKLEAEIIVKREMRNNWAIGRLSTQYGVHPDRRNLAYDFAKRFVTGQEARAASDFVSSPTYSGSSASMLVEISERRMNGIFHLADSISISRFDFAVALREILGLKEKEVKLTKISVRDLNWIAPRPLNSSLNNSKAKSTLSNSPLTLKEGLRLFLRDWKNMRHN